MLLKNQTAPPVNSISISGQRINLSELNGKKVLIKFHRFSGCPIVQRQVHELLSHQEKLNAAGYETIVFMHSSKEKIEPVYKEVPGLHIIADREKKFYRLYNAEFSWKKLFSIATWRETFSAILKGYYPLFNRFQGGIIGVPSDFLINEQGIITNLHYGKHFGDSWTVPEVLKNS
jgi:peroxiredoxin